MSGAIGAIGSIAGAVIGGRAADKASDRAAQGRERSSAELRGAFGRTEERFQPYLDPSFQGFQDFTDVLGGDLTSFEASPFGTSYTDFLQSETQRGIETSAAATGGLLSGGTVKELQDRLAGIASQDYLGRVGTFLDASRGLGQTGLDINTLLSNADLSTAKGIGQNFVGIGDVKGQAQIARGKAFQQGIGGALDLGQELYKRKQDTGSFF